MLFLVAIHWQFYFKWHGFAFVIHRGRSTLPRSPLHRRCSEPPLFLSTRPPIASVPSGEPQEASSFIEEARVLLNQNDTDAAYDLLIQASQCTGGGALHTVPGLLSGFEELFRRKISLQESKKVQLVGDYLPLFLDRMGLASLLSDQGRYKDAAHELGLALKTVNGDGAENLVPFVPQGILDKATSMIFRTQAAICEWGDYERASQDLLLSSKAALLCNETPAIHPFEALTWPCVSLEMATRTANAYAKRALATVDRSTSDNASVPETSTWQDIEQRLLRTTISNITVKSSVGINQDHDGAKNIIKVGYLSPDFTGRHPLAFLMQDVFRFHNQKQFDVFIYSLEESDGSVEVEKIRTSTSSQRDWRVLRGNVRNMTDTIAMDNLDILIDLCGYTGTSVVADIMAHRMSAPIQVSYMGFPGSSGAPYIDWMIADATVIPSQLRSCYTESILFMPHCYFVNSHQFLPKPEKTATARSEYQLPPSPAFVFCCHSRPDKIDPVTFATWVGALYRTRQLESSLDRKDLGQAVLWLLRSDRVMEDNLRKVAEHIWKALSKESQPFPQGCLVFCDKAPRDEHLRRLCLADVFLDTPAYNAHTVGCDCLKAGVPMISLLHNDSVLLDEGDTSTIQVATDKLASRVGASLLQSVQGTLSDRLVVPSMQAYEDCMVDCAINGLIVERKHLLDTAMTAPLWDTARWVKNLEAGLRQMANLHERGATDTDIYVKDNG